eukprot:NODE_1398_length_876_cov_71.473965_g1352_i0.p1 GENE.NODE_1398_length_876_cov_71.473965_g1352_i0~~NODE_1398_length_876_cov_71.473965_g1352_i0.p1  ORF type:complete len:251 (-),score=60.68 NODE_1398_length_876_cov_71.473965_g1352_i0:12-764(-)
MKINIANPPAGTQKLINIDEERKLTIFYDKRISAEVPGDSLGEEWKGYVMRITGGNDKQGFPMKQGVLTTGRARLLLKKGHSCYRPRRTGQRKRKSVHGCIVNQDLSVLNLVIVKKGEKDIPGLTDKSIPLRRGPKRASKIRKLFGLEKQDDVRKFVIRRELPAKEGKKPVTRAPKIQRLVTPVVLQRKRRRQAQRRKRAEAAREAASEYHKLLAQRVREERSKRKSLKQRRISSVAQSKSKSESKSESK